MSWITQLDYSWFSYEINILTIMWKCIIQLSSFIANLILQPQDFWIKAPKKGIVVFALPGEPGLTELAGDFKIHFQESQGDFYWFLDYHFLLISSLTCIGPNNSYHNFLNYVAHLYLFIFSFSLFHLLLWPPCIFLPISFHSQNCCFSLGFSFLQRCGMAYKYRSRIH